MLSRFRQLLAGMPDRSPPATWWTSGCDLALLWGMYRAGYGEYDTVFTDLEFLPTFKAARVSNNSGESDLRTGGYL